MKPLTIPQFVCYCASFAVALMILTLGVTWLMIIALLLIHAVEEMARAKRNKWISVLFYGLLLVLFIQEWRHGLEFNIRIQSLNSYVVLFMLWLVMVFNAYRRWKKALTAAHDPIKEGPRSLWASLPPWNVDNW